MDNLLMGLYYPFSRCTQPNSLKQMLLVFDQITFVDPVGDTEWRAKLFEDMEGFDTEFAKHRDINTALPTLMREGCLKRFDPQPTINQRKLAAASAMADLRDNDWIREAARPTRHRMPSIRIGGRSSWQVFRPKIPDHFLQSLQESERLRSHLLIEGRPGHSWSLSYEAGSALAISLHLEIADELGLAPVTDSAMHHHLMLAKVARGMGSSQAPIAGDLLNILTVRVASELLRSTLPEEQLAAATFEDILRFREVTRSCRRAFISDLQARIGQLRSLPNPEEWSVIALQVLSSIQSDIRKYDAEFSASTSKVWPNVIRSTTTAAATAGSLAAVGFSLIPGPHAALLTGAAAAAAGALAGGMEAFAEQRRLRTLAAPPVAYLSKVNKLGA